jgi:hypothetical protein
MADVLTTERVELTVRLDNTRPVDVSDLGQSLQAIGKQYEEFVVSHGYQTPANARLFVTHLETGSIIITLQTLLDPASFLLKHVEVLAGFVANLNEIINYLLHLDKAPKPEPITRNDVERISTILEPVAKDSGSQVTFNITGNTAPPPSTASNRSITVAKTRPRS